MFKDIYVPPEGSELVNLPKESNIIKQVKDKINHPVHYTQGKIETWDFILDKKLDYCSGNVIKYVVRADHKGNKLEDLKKARCYLDKLIEEEDKKNNKVNL